MLIDAYCSPNHYPFHPPSKYTHTHTHPYRERLYHGCWVGKIWSWLLLQVMLHHVILTFNTLATPFILTTPFTPSTLIHFFPPPIHPPHPFLVPSLPGSGKTFAFALPALQSLLTQEEEGYVRLPRRPRCIILVPTRELARQVLDTLHNITHF